MTEKTKDEAGFVFVPPPDDKRTRAERYAQAMSAAAAANQRIQELERNLATAEYYREQLETELSGIRWDNDALGTVYTHASDEPLHEFIMDIRTGDVWRFDNLAVEWQDRWHRLDGEGGSNYVCGWPIDDGGPFIVVPEDWNLKHMIDRSQERRETEDRLHWKLRERDGYRTEDEQKTYARPDLAKAVERILATDDLKSVNARSAALKADQERLEALKALEAEKAKAAKGYGPVLNGIVEALPDATRSIGSRSLHEVVRQAELAILRDCEVPIDGDPSYKAASLMSAAALLVLASEAILKAERALAPNPAREDPAPDRSLPF